MTNFSKQWDQSIGNMKIGIDWPLLIAVIALIIFGLMMVFSATTSIRGQGVVRDPVDHFRTQLFSMVLGIFFGFLIMIIPSNWFRRYEFIILQSIIMLLLLIYVHFFGITSGGAKSWMNLGVTTFQPSEIFKLVSIFMFSWLLVYLERIPNLTKDKYNDFNFYALIALFLISLILILLQPDIGMVLIIFTTVAILFIMIRYSPKVLLISFSSIIIVSFLLNFIAANYLGEAGPDRHYIINRLIVFSDPFSFANDEGFQLTQSYQAIINGGFLGRGLGQSLMKHLGRLPASENDFILAILIEELGVLGGIILLLLYLFIIFRLILWSSHSVDSFRSKMLLGIGILFFVQISVNVGGVLRLIPLTGVTLPFISEGGTSLLMFIITMAVAIRIIIEEKALALR